MRLAVLLICFFGAYAIGVIFFGEGARSRRRVRRQMESLLGGRGTRAARELSQPADGGLAVRKPLTARLTGAIGKLVEGRPAADSLATRLRQAGWKIQVSEFVLICAVAAVATFALSLLLIPDALVRLVAAVAGGLAPFVRLAQRTTARRKLFEAQLIDALSMIANALRSGYSFLQAMDVAARELPEPISGEFEQVLRETRVNISVDDALAGMVVRTGSPDLDMAVTAISIQRQVGGNLGEVLENISTTIRDRLRVRGEIRAITAQGRLSAWIVGLLPVVLTLVIYLMNRAYMQVLFTNTVGKLALGLAVVMECIGIFLIRRIIQIEI